jgi:predicted neutral ceramidase superfamily lipid hydrolase
VSADFETMFLILVVGTTVPLTLFPAVFAIGARKSWWRTPAGRALMVSTTSLAAVLYVTLARQIFGDYPYRREVLMLVFTGVFVGAWLKLGALVYELSRGRHPRRRRGLTDHDESHRLP